MDPSEQWVLNLDLDFSSEGGALSLNLNNHEHYSVVKYSVGAFLMMMMSHTIYTLV